MSSALASQLLQQISKECYGIPWPLQLQQVSGGREVWTADLATGMLFKCLSHAWISIKVAGDSRSALGSRLVPERRPCRVGSTTLTRLSPKAFPVYGPSRVSHMPCLHTHTHTHTHTFTHTARRPQEAKPWSRVSNFLVPWVLRIRSLEVLHMAPLSDHRVRSRSFVASGGRRGSTEGLWEMELGSQTKFQEVHSSGCHFRVAVDAAHVAG